ncbi:peptide-methionine (S)-S-oxide reductase [Pedobacter sp. HMWF019]|uniref:peptide-methionine (S)-S-oxide reductase MsrA n=1 Tax=Pedobacter sp. HMWF019 TaxID=2056856 RepID=UPI000D339442|nr:peptide-methionine (S)-S-oxide reductase MsrA [Pedobacter sp. HMWF019]PTS94311.1 peptide-methionine (S)-S-oxide reductase [Pedobacter sp. HMWF019]
MRPELLFMIAALLFLGGCSSDTQHLQSHNGFAVLPALQKNEKVADFAGGCFWAMQECMLELKGVRKVISGYAGGQTRNPDYTAVSAKNTGHAESVQVYYDPSVISYEQLVLAFFYAHDPTQIDGQGPDLGTDYRSIAFYRSPQEYKIIRAVMDKVEQSNYYTDPLITELKPFEVFYPAEMAHQDYYRIHSWEPYIRRVSKPKVLKMRTHVPDLVRPEYLH